MRSGLVGELMRAVSRFAFVGVVGGLGAGCSSDSLRFSENPFSNPFTSTAQAAEPGMTGSIDRPGSLAPLPAGRARSEPLQPIRMAELAPARTAAAPAPKPARPAAASAAGWSTEGGTVLTIKAGDTLATISDRYGVPSAALLSANGLKAGQVTAGRRIIVPVYSTAARAVRATPAPAPDSASAAAPKPMTALVRKVAAAPAPKPAEPAAAKVAAAPAAKPAPIKIAAAPAKVVTAKVATAPVKVAVTPAKVVAPAAKTTPAPVKVATAAAPKSPAPAPKVVVAQAATPAARPAKPAAEPIRIAARTPDPKRAELLDPKTTGSVEPKTAAARPARPATEPAAPAVQATNPGSPKPVAQPKPVKVEAPVKAVKSEPPKAEVAKPAKALEAPKAAAAAKPTVASAPQPVAAAPAPTKEPDATSALQPAAPAAEFRWPARGRVIAGFGGSGANEGVNIAVPEGTPVKAAEAGTVAYAGSEVKGYGNLVLIKHDNGYVSAYAHNGDLDVKRGQKVTRGQTIAKSGQTGNVTSPQVHFEIRKGSTPVDPMRYLASN